MVRQGERDIGLMVPTIPADPWISGPFNVYRTEPLLQSTDRQRQPWCLRLQRLPEVSKAADLVRGQLENPTAAGKDQTTDAFSTVPVKACSVPDGCLS